MNAILWADGGFLGGILAGVGKLLGVDTSGMSSTVALIAVAFAAYTWWSKNRPQPVPTPTPAPTPDPVPAPAPSPSPSPVLPDVLVKLGELAPLLIDLLKRRSAGDAAEPVQLTAETLVVEEAPIASESHRRERQIVRGTLRDELVGLQSELAAFHVAASDPDTKAIDVERLVGIVNKLILLYPYIRLALKFAGITLPDISLRPISIKSQPVATSLPETV